MKQIHVVIRLLGTVIGVFAGLVLYFVGVVLGVAWSALKTVFTDALVGHPIPTTPDGSSPS